MKKEMIRSLPKIELHCHLDGSVQIKTLEKLAVKAGVPLESLTKVIAPKKCQHLKEYLESFDCILPLLQSEENLAIAAYDLIEQASEDNICYLEIRFAPLLHQEHGLSIEQILRAVCHGIQLAQEQFAVQTNLLISALRHHSAAANKQLIDAIKQLNSEKIVGFDFAGDEQAVTNETIKATADYMLASGLELTLHSGECGCAQNVVEAIRLGASRIGHGVAIKDDPATMDCCAEKGTLLELCPTSNIQTNAIKEWTDYPLRTFLEHHVKCCINTDNRTVSQTTLTEEYSLLAKYCQLSYPEMKTLNLNAIEGAFASPRLKEQLTKRINSGYAKVIAATGE
ncbi:adenosine deaminase [Enterococcus hulanensis]|uniref:adenosine deaminase n=1 Tax=Enterococcus TaxID=1350 RepID=UPI000B5A39C0|nr:MULTISPECIES: adenosine deaminase [Enterococcus]MBO0411288.1 adenosine deaminase [Enterococcus hulanensis]OTO21397.1 adenosine deaminase [Enterococcus sp. 3H8_DIV0648]